MSRSALPRRRALLILALAAPLALAGPVQADSANPLTLAWNDTKSEAGALWERARSGVGDAVDSVSRRLDQATEEYRDWRGEWPPERRLERPIPYLNFLDQQFAQRLDTLDAARRSLLAAYRRAEAENTAAAQAHPGTATTAASAAAVLWERYNTVQAAYGRVAEARRMLPVWISLIQANRTLEGMEVLFGNAELVLAETGKLIVDPYLVRSPEELLKTLETTPAAR